MMWLTLYGSADWLTEDEVSNYHTFTIPYGPKFNAKRIEKLCYTRDLCKLLSGDTNANSELTGLLSAQCRVEPARRERRLSSPSPGFRKTSHARL
jgi:hypothetical protein